MTPARKLHIWTKQHDAGGVARCGCGCGDPVDLTGPGVIYEHVIPWWFDPARLDDDGPNVQAWRKACAKAKTGGKAGDLSRIAKTKRQIGMAVGAERPQPSLKSRGGFPSGRKLPGRGKGPRLKSRPLTGSNSFRR